MFCVSRRAHERPPPHPHRMHPNYGHGHHIHVPQTMSSHPRQAPERSAWSVSCLFQSYAQQSVLELSEQMLYSGHTEQWCGETEFFLICETLSLASYKSLKWKEEREFWDREPCQTGVELFCWFSGVSAIKVNSLNGSYSHNFLIYYPTFVLKSALPLLTPVYWQGKLSLCPRFVVFFREMEADLH